jgi:hypothetical protein
MRRSGKKFPNVLGVTFLLSELVSCVPRYGPALLGSDLPYMNMPVFEDRTAAEVYISASATNSMLDLGKNGNNNSYQLSIHNGLAFKNFNTGMGINAYAGGARNLNVSRNILYNPTGFTDDKNFYGAGVRGQINYAKTLNKFIIRGGAKASVTAEYGDYFQFRRVAHAMEGIINMRKKNYFISYAIFGELKIPFENKEKEHTGHIGIYAGVIYSTMDTPRFSQSYPSIGIVCDYKRFHFLVSAQLTILDDAFLAATITYSVIKK